MPGEYVVIVAVNYEHGVTWSQTYDVKWDMSKVGVNSFMAEMGDCTISDIDEILIFNGDLMKRWDNNE